MTISDYNCPDTVIQLKYILVQPTSVEESNADHDLLVFPNPATDQLKIRVKTSEIKIISARLLDVYGREVGRSENIFSDEAVITSPAGGLFYLEIRLSNGQAAYRKILFKN